MYLVFITRRVFFVLTLLFLEDQPEAQLGFTMFFSAMVSRHILVNAQVLIYAHWVPFKRLLENTLFITSEMMFFAVLCLLTHYNTQERANENRETMSKQSFNLLLIANAIMCLTSGWILLAWCYVIPFSAYKISVASFNLCCKKKSAVEDMHPRGDASLTQTAMNLRVSSLSGFQMTSQADDVTKDGLSVFSIDEDRIRDRISKIKSRTQRSIREGKEEKDSAR